jgi:single-strand DNA-binding protein
MSNVLSFTGTIGKDAEVRYLPSAQAVLSVNVANHIGFGEKRQTIWVRVTLWGKRAEGELKNHLLKGREVFVSGELTLSEYTANDGTRKTQLELNANIIDLVGKREDQTPSQYERPTSVASAPMTAQYNQPPPVNSGLKYPENGAPYDDDDIPF